MVQVLLNTGLLKGAISRFASRKIRKVYGYSAKVELQELKLIEDEDEMITLSINGTVKMNKAELKRLIDSIGKDPD